MVHRVVSHQVSAQQLARYQLQRSVFQALQDRKIIELADNIRLAIGLATSAATVFLSAERHRHILERRQVSRQIDADIAANRIGEALSDIRFKRNQLRRSDVWDVIGYIASVQTHLLVALKLVPAVRSAKQSDELRIQTAYPIGKKRLRKWLATSDFIEIGAT